MTEKKYNEIVEYFKECLNCDDRTARKLANIVDNIVFNSHRENNPTFVQMVMFGVRNAFWEGEK